MLSRFMSQLSDAEREAVGVAAVITFHETDTLGYQGSDLKPLTLSTNETIEVAPVKAYETYRDDAKSRLVSSLCSSVFPRKSYAERDDVITAPSHAMVSMSRISAGGDGGVTLFDHIGKVSNPIALRLNTARDYPQKDRASSTMMRMEEKQLLEIMLSSSQYARLIRSDSSLTPCTFTRRERVGHDLECNPHFEDDFDGRNIEKEAYDLLSTTRARIDDILEPMKNGLTRKSEREAAEEKIKALLDELDQPIQALHQLADSGLEQTGHSANLRHNNLMAREVAALPPGMRQQLKQLSDAGDSLAKMLINNSQGE